MIKLLKKLIFTKEESKRVERWTIEKNGHEASERLFEEFHKYMTSVMMRDQK